MHYLDQLSYIGSISPDLDWGLSKIFILRYFSGETAPNDSIAHNFLKLYHLKDDVDALIVKTFDVSLILYAEHDFNASTFAARVTVSTLSDFYSGNNH